MAIANERLEDKTLLAAISGYKWHDDGNMIRGTNLISGNYAVMIVDVSQSTNDPFSGTENIGDMNDDGLHNTILDAQIAAYIELNQHLVDLGLGSTGQVSIIMFSAEAEAMDMNPTLDGYQSFATPLSDADGNNQRDVEDILRSIKLDHGLGNSTNYEAPLIAAQSVISNIEPVSSIVFLSDGTRNSGGPYRDEVEFMRSKGASLRAFGVGDQAQLPDLQVIDPQAAIFTNTQELLGAFRGNPDAANGDHDNSVLQWTEPGVPGWTIYVDLNNNYRQDADEPFDITDANGNYVISDLPEGKHVVREEQRWGWRQIYPELVRSHEVTLGDEDVSGVNFANGLREKNHLYVSDIEGILGRIEVPAGKITLIGDMGTVMTDIAIGANGGFFGVTASDLYSIHPETGAATHVGQLGVGEVTSLDFGPEDVLYAVRQRSVYRIDTETGEATWYANLNYTAEGDISFRGSTMFMSTTSNLLISFDIETLEQKELGYITDGDVHAMDLVGDEMIGVRESRLLSISALSGEASEGPIYFGAALSRALGAAYGSPRIAPPAPVRGALQGSIWNDLNENGIQDGSEQPFRGVEVFLDVNDDGVRNSSEPTAFTDDDGHYEFTDLPPGDYVVRQTLSGGDIQTAPEGYLGSAYFSQTVQQTRLVEITSGTGQVTPLGDRATSVRMHGIARTNQGDIFGVNFSTDTVYRIDPATGRETTVGIPGAELTGGLTYVADTDTLYTVARFTSDAGHRLMTVDQASGALTPVGDEVPQINGLSGLAYDWKRDVFIAYDNFDDEFFEFNRGGGGRKISDATPHIASWSLAFNGTDFLMASLDNPGRIVRVNPQTGTWQQAFDLSDTIRLESLDYSRTANIPHRVTISSADPITELDFGRKGPPRDIIVTQSNNTVVTEAGGTDTFVVRLASAPASDVVLEIFANDATEVQVLDATITLTPDNWHTGVTVTVRGVDDAIIDGDIASFVSIVVNDNLSDDAFDGLTARLRAVTRDNDVPATNTHIAGMVWRDENRNGVQDAGEEPLAGAQVYLDANDNGRRDPGERFLPSRDDGSFEFRDIDPGSYVVRQLLHGPTFQSSPATFIGVNQDDDRLFYLDPDTLRIRSLPSSAGTALSSVLMTRNGRVFATGSDTNSLYRLDAHTGAATLVDSWGTPSVEALAYDPQADRIFALARPQPGSSLLRLYLVNRNDASLTAIGNGINGIQQASAVTFDDRAGRLIVFDNSDDEFYAFELNGLARKLSNAAAPVNSLSLAFDGQQFLMQLRQPPDDRQLLTVNPDTGAVQNGARTLSPMPTSAFDFAPFADTGHRVAITRGQTVGGLKFGQFTVPPGFRTSETGTGTVVRESGTSDQLRVALNRRPDFPVVIDVFAQDPTEVGVAAVDRRLTFTPEDWNQPQSVTVFGQNDEDPDGSQRTQVVFRVNVDLSDDAFDSLPDQGIDVVTIDDDTPGITVSPASLIVTEDGGTDQFSVVLNAEPASNVTVDISSTDTGEASVGPHVMTFTPFNWDIPQIVTVTGADDILVDGHAVSQVTVQVRDGVSDDDYDPLPDQHVSVTTLDDDSTGLYVDRTDLTVLESARPDHFHVVLTAAPVSNVVLNVASSDPDEVIVSTSTLVFTPSNWSTPQRVSVSGRSDEVLDGNQDSILTISVDAAASDDAYDAAPDIVLPVTNQDSNVATMEVSNSLLRVSEDGRSDTFFVRLTAAPLSPVVVSVTTSDPNEAVVDRTRLTFTPSNWNSGQIVRVTGVDDLPIDGEQERAIALSIIDSLSDDAFDGAPDLFLRVLNSDNDIAGFTLSKKTATVSEAGTTDTFTVVLNTVPTSDVVLNVGRQSSGEVVESPFRLTFTTDNWNVPQSVTLRGVDDAVDDGDTVTEVQVAVVANLTDDAYDEVPVQSVFVTTVDNDQGSAKPTVTGPGGRQSVGSALTLSWDSVPAAQSYEVWLEFIGGGATNPVANPTVSRLTYTLAEGLPIGRYRTWVRANLSGNQKTDWATGRFDVSGAPVFQPLPFHGEDRTPTIRWNAVTGATSYRLFASNITTGTNAVVDTTITGTSFTVPSELGFGRHRIWVRAIGTGGYAAEWSSGLDYYVGPNLQTPVRSTFDVRPDFSWESMSGIATYQLYVQKGATVVVNESGLSSTTFTPNFDLAAGDYRWWIRPFTAAGRGGAWSRTGEFNVGGRPRILQAAPRNDGLLDVAWQPVDGASSYEIYLYNDDGRGLVHRESGLTATSFSFSPLPDGDYRVWIRSYRGAGSPAAWSRAYSFELNAARSNATASPQSPITPSFNRRPAFRWSNGAGTNSVDLFATDGDSVIHQTGLTGISWRPAADLAAQRWTWWVRAHANAGPGPWSSPAQTDLSGRAVILGPIGSTTDRTPTIQWTPVAGAGRYIFQLDNLTTHQNAVVRNNQVAAATFTVSDELTPGTYRAWVQAIHGDTNASAPWSLKFEFTVTAAEAAAKRGTPESPLVDLVGLPPAASSVVHLSNAFYDSDAAATAETDPAVVVTDARGDLVQPAAGRNRPASAIAVQFIMTEDHSRPQGEPATAAAAFSDDLDLLMADPRLLAAVVDGV